METVSYPPRRIIKPEWKKDWKWWFGNVDDPLPPQGYLPTRPMWWRKTCWFFRNFMHNYKHYVKGCGDQHRIVKGDYPYEKWNPYGTENHLTVTAEDGKVHIFYSKRLLTILGTKWEYYKGCGPKGDYGMAFRRYKSTNAGDM